MKRTYSLMLVGVMALAPVTRAAIRTVTTDAATGAGSLTAAINALNDGDTIAFNIPPGTGEVHYIQTPFDGYPLITKNNITIDGYTQPGAAPNTNSIHAANNASLKIVLTSTNGNALSMYTACSTFAGIAYPNFGFGDTETAILGCFRASNVWVKGLVFQASPYTSTTQAPPDPTLNNAAVSKAICFAMDAPDVSDQRCQGFHVSGCWFGVDPVTKQVAYCQDPLYSLGTQVATPTICIATYGTGTNGTIAGFPNINNWPGPGTVGVAAGSSTPRAEFNVFVTGYGFDSQGGPLRVSGNFWGVLPDGVTAADMSVLSSSQQGDGFTEYGDAHDILIGTDGDGVNDADESNIFGPWANGGSVCVDFYSGPQANIVIAGNSFNADIHGNSFGANLGYIIHSIGNTATLRFGSDFNGVSDALEGNLAFNELLFDFDNNWPTNLAWISMRGNSMTNCSTPASSTPPLGDGYDGPSYGLNTYSQFIDTTGPEGALDILPVIGAGTTATSLSGTCGKPLGAPYTNLVVDLYQADPTPSAPPQGMKWLASFTDNSAADSNPAVGAFTFSTAGLGLTSGEQVTITVTYTSDPRPIIGSIARAGNQTTINIKNGPTTYGIQKSVTANGTYTNTISMFGTATFTDNNSPASFYRATGGGTANGQTSPFSAVYTIP